VLRYATNRNMLAINSAATPDTGVVAQLVDVGAGAAADFERVDVTGKIVLASGAMGQVFTQAMRRGAVGVMTHRVPAYNQPEKHRNSISFGSINDSTNTRWGIFLSRNAQDRLRQALARGPVSVRVVSRTRSYPSEELTLVAEVHGSVRPQERFVSTAHVQEPGANDNASGVAVQAEMARVLATLLREGRIDPKRTITMIFGDEINQTQTYLAADSARTRNVLWGLSLDMVGQDTEKTGGTFLIEKMPDPAAIWTRGEEKHSEWGGSPITKEQLRPHYFNDFLIARALEQSAATGWVVKWNPYEGGSDHVPFLRHNRPGVLFWHFTDVFYHTDGDRLENVSRATLANVGSTALASILTLTTADGATARALVGEVERAAMRRLDVETALSRAAIAAGGDVALETDILTTWRDYYVDVIATMHDVETGGASAATRAAIDAAIARVRAVSVPERLR
jgi:aminopeptidase YwaD